ncbi:MAG: hypothetical protein AB1556_17420, partial [Bacillota bacterium]
MTEGADLVPQASLAGAKKWRRYPAYKDSGIEWLGEIPEHWEVKRLKFVVKINSNTLSEKTDPDYVIKYIDIGNVVGENGMLTEPEEMAFANAPSRARRLIKKDNVI